MAASPTLDELKSTIRRAGLRSTAPRVAVLRRLLRTSAPISHGELVAVLAGEGMDRTTVYRNLVDLTDAGLVQRTDLGDHVWRFELRRAERALRHPHFTCVDCGAVACLPDVKVSVKPGRGVPRALQHQQVEVQLRGKCDACS
jgi:Fur family transcriptional regulator, ferric uptake regulator